MLTDSLIALNSLMDEKTCVVDLTKAILESSNQNLRQTLTQMRNQAEQSQQEIYHIAEQTGGYLASAPADHQLISRVDNYFQQMSTQFSNQYNQVGSQYNQGYTGTNVNQGNSYNYNQQVRNTTPSSFSNIDPLKHQGTPQFSNY